MKNTKKFSLFVACIVSFSTLALAWGQTGHRVVGQIGWNHLDQKARAKVKAILGGQSMAIVATWPDDIRSNPKYDYTHPWHYVDIPDNKTYAQSEKNPKGDIVEELPKLIAALKKGGLDSAQERFDLIFVIHLVGDMHQPLHVGRGSDRGGNSIKLEWFRKRTNLHAIWDSGMIRAKELSYTELAAAIDHPTKAQIKEWQNSTIMDWVKEDKSLRKSIYDFGDKTDLWYPYLESHWKIVTTQLEKAGVRLAGILNTIYG